MALLHGKSCAVLVSSNNLSAYFNSADTAQSVETAETTAFGSSAKSYIVGLRDGTISLAGMFDGAAGAVDSVLGPALAGSALPVSLGVAGVAHGNRATMMQAHETGYSVTAAVADVVQVSADLQSADGLFEGNFLRALTAETASTTGTALDNAASSANGLRAALHVTAGTGSMTVKVQHSADNSTWVDLITFTAATGATAEWKTVSGTVNRYLRVASTISGGSPSFTYTVSVAR